MIFTLLGLAVTVGLFLLWLRLGRRVFWDRKEDEGVDPVAPSAKIPIAFFGYMLALILLLGAVQGFAVRFAQFSRADLWPASSYLIPAAMLVVGFGLAAVCLIRGRRTNAR